MFEGNKMYAEYRGCSESEKCNYTLVYNFISIYIYIYTELASYTYPLYIHYIQL